MTTQSNPSDEMSALSNQVDNLDLEALGKIRTILNEFYPEVRKAMLEYCLFITEKDLEG